MFGEVSVLVIMSIICGIELMVSTIDLYCSSTLVVALSCLDIVNCCGSKQVPVDVHLASLSGLNQSMPYS